jgi:hypothetical protein
VCVFVCVCVCTIIQVSGFPAARLSGSIIPIYNKGPISGTDQAMSRWFSGGTVLYSQLTVVRCNLADDVDSVISIIYHCVMDYCRDMV